MLKSVVSSFHMFVCASRGSAASFDLLLHRHLGHTWLLIHSVTTCPGCASVGRPAENRRYSRVEFFFVVKGH